MNQPAATPRRPPAPLAALLAVALGALGAHPPTALAGGGGALPGLDADQSPTDGSALASLTLVSEHGALTPGAESWIGLHFKIADGWHLYWRNNGDTGAPMRIILEAPPGVELGGIVYPAPKRHPVAGGFVDFVYEDEVTLLVPVSVSGSPQAGATVRIEADVQWLICNDICLAGAGQAAIELPIAGAPRPTPHAGLFAAARSRVPAPMADALASGIRARWNAEHELAITAPGATALVFFPYESDANAYPQDMAERGVAEGQTIRLSYDEHVDDAASVAGVLEVRTPEKTSWYEIVVERPGEGVH